MNPPPFFVPMEKMLHLMCWEQMLEQAQLKVVQVPWPAPLHSHFQINGMWGNPHGKMAMRSKVVCVVVKFYQIVKILHLGSTRIYVGFYVDIILHSAHHSMTAWRKCYVPLVCGPLRFVFPYLRTLSTFQKIELTHLVGPMDGVYFQEIGFWSKTAKNRPIHTLHFSIVWKNFFYTVGNCW